MADIVYTLDGDVYLNITNKCPCNCAFCIRTKCDAYGDSEELWFDTEPTFEEIKNAIDTYDFHNVNKAVFCGYGEPTNAYDNLIKSAKYLNFQVYLIIFQYHLTSLTVKNMIKLHEIALRARHLMQCSNLLKNVLHTVLK